MTGSGLRVLAASLALLASAPPVAAAEPLETPQHNPFRRPAQALVSPGVQGGGSDAAAPLELTGLLLAGPDSVASINGELLGIGDRINGYRLLTIKGTQAVLVKKGKRVILDMETED